ncbi:MAG: YraN family protein [Christensenellaceae bacterium]|jgi:putative endonuclease|nr:YraN family protein [Christensenellaceae bacterium]
MYSREDINEYNKHQQFDQALEKFSGSRSFNKQTGNIGEAIAEKILKDKGYKIITVNYTNKIGEIDIIAQQKDTIVFVEVKMRASLGRGTPREAVNTFKQRKIRQVAEAFLKSKRMLDVGCRFDCIEIVGSADKHTIEHLEGCF